MQQQSEASLHPAPDGLVKLSKVVDVPVQGRRTHKSTVYCSWHKDTATITFVKLHSGLLTVPMSTSRWLLYCTLEVLPT